jgi:hypothetical protein
LHPSCSTEFEGYDEDETVRVSSAAAINTEIQLLASFLSTSNRKANSVGSIGYEEDHDKLVTD